MIYFPYSGVKSRTYWPVKRNVALTCVSTDLPTPCVSGRQRGDLNRRPAHYECNQVSPRNPLTSLRKGQKALNWLQKASLLALTYLYQPCSVLLSDGHHLDTLSSPDCEAEGSCGYVHGGASSFPSLSCPLAKAFLLSKTPKPKELLIWHPELVPILAIPGPVGRNEVEPISCQSSPSSFQAIPEFRLDKRILAQFIRSIQSGWLCAAYHTEAFRPKTVRRPSRAVGRKTSALLLSPDSSRIRGRSR